MSNQEFSRWLAELITHQDRDPVVLLSDLCSAISTGRSGLLDAAASLASQHPALQGEDVRIRNLLGVLAARRDLVRQVGGNPQNVLDGAARAELLQARTLGEAVRTIWLEPMLRAEDAAVALGAKSTNREKVRNHRTRSWLLGLPLGRGYVYPAFQFSTERRNVFPCVRRVNELLVAADDPWGAASWWISSNARLGTKPVDLIGTDRENDLISAAGSVAELVG